MRRTVWCAIFVTSLLFSRVAFAHGPIVETDKGLVQGVMENGIALFKGIPFAAPPVGDLRWHSPVEAECWSGVRPCDKFGPVPLQPMEHPLVSETSPQSEDCLYLNVWTPHINSPKPLPVMVWIFGGAFRGGSGSNPEYDGTDLAKEGVVLVTFNYRVGIFGFYVHQKLANLKGEDHCGNYGLLDQIAALKWVQRNIASFGGNPDNVTIFGESAGGASVSFLYTSPLTDGLFHRAIAESGSIFGDLAVCPDASGSFAQAAKNGSEAIKKMGFSSLRDMSQAPAGDLLSLEPELTFAPVIDGWIIPGAPQYAFKSLKKKVPLMTGTNSDEGLPFCNSRAGSLSAYKGWLSDYYGSKDKIVFRRFPASNDLDVARIHPFVSTLTAFTAPARSQALSVQKLTGKSYLYYFDFIPPTEEGKKMGSYHTAEIPYVFGNLPEDEGYGDRDRLLSDAIQKYWVNFAATGDPEGENSLRWHPFSYEDQKVLFIRDDASISIEDHPFPSECDFIMEAIPIIE